MHFQDFNEEIFKGKTVDRIVKDPEFIQRHFTDGAVLTIMKSFSNEDIPPAS